MIYVQTSWHKDEQTLDENIKANQDLWRKSEPMVEITPLGSVSRGADRTAPALFQRHYVALTVEGWALEARRHPASGCSAL